MSLGFKRAGWDVLGVERDGDAWHTHVNEVGPCRLADITEFRPAQDYDAVVGGVPCQGFSMAGLRKGSSLFRELIRIGVEANARALMLENVEGMTSWRDKIPTSPTFGQTMPEIIEWEMACAGYVSQWRVINCADYGTPQARRRIIFVAFADTSDWYHWEWPTESHGENRKRPWVTVRDALGLTGEWRKGLKDGASPASPQGMRYLDVDKPATTVAHVGELLSPLDLPSPCITATEHKSAKNFGARGGKTKPRHALERLQVALDRPAPVISATGHDTARDKNRPSRRPIAELRAALLDAPSPTVKANSGHEGTSERATQRPSGEIAAALSDHAMRLGPAELAKLQGFPPGFRFHGPKTAQYRQIGNAFPPQPAEALARALADALDANRAPCLPGSEPQK